MRVNARCLIFAACLLLLFLTAPAPGTRAAEPLRIGSAKRLTWDESLFDKLEGIRFEMQRAHRTGERNLVAEKPWESWQIGGMSKILQDQGKFRMWYAVSHGIRHGEEYAVAYAESDDGIHWVKPELGIVEYDGSKKNNLVVGYSTAFGDVFVDPNAPAESRYRMSTARFPKKDGDPKRFLAVITSPDGLRWSTEEHPVIPVDSAALDTQSQVFWDRDRRQYLLFTRRGPWRRVARSESDDSQRFPAPKIVMQPENPAVEDYYQGGVIKYEEAASAYVGLVPCFFHPGDAAGKPVGRNRGLDVTYNRTKITVVAPDTIDLHLFTSNDSVEWRRRGDHAPIIGLGADGSFDSRSLYPGGGYAVVGDEIWLYYSGYDVTHLGCLQDPQPFERRLGTISRATLRLDGFVAATAGHDGAELITKPLTFDGNRLQLNVDCSAGGFVDAELQNAAGEPIAGFALDDSDRVYHNNVRKTVTWKGGPDVSSLAGKPVRLRLVLRDARLYAFQFRSGGT